MKNSKESFGTPEGCFLCSENASEVRIQRADKWERLFLKVRLLSSKTQCSSDITSKIRIYRNIFELPPPKFG